MSAFDANGGDAWQAEFVEDFKRRVRARRSERVPTLTAADLAASHTAEWDARPPGRLGKPLLAEIESYLSFFAVARAHG